MTVESLSMSTVKILANEVELFLLFIYRSKLSGFDVEQVEQIKKILGTDG